MPTAILAPQERSLRPPLQCGGLGGLAICSLTCPFQDRQKARSLLPSPRIEIMAAGWIKLIPPDDLFKGEGNYRLDAYSEFLPAPRIGWKPYGGRAPNAELFTPNDPYGWNVGEFEEILELQAGMT